MKLSNSNFSRGSPLKLSKRAETKKKEQRIAPLLPQACTLPQVLAKVNYCSCLYGAVTQVKATVVGAPLCDGSY